MRSLDAVLERAGPSPEAVVLAWAGGALHERQAGRALEVLGAPGRRMIRGSRGRGRWCAWLGRRMPGWPSWWPRCRWLAGRRWPRRCWARRPGWPLMRSAGLADRVVARQAVHHVRGDLAGRSGLTGVQIGLIRGLEKLGDLGAAYDVATAALAELEALPPAARDAGQRQELLMAVLRLARTRPGQGQDEDPVAAEAVELALSGGAAVRPEARVWAAVDLLHRPGPPPGRAAAGPPGHRRTGSRGHPRRARRPVAAAAGFPRGQAGDTALAQRLLATMINTGPTGQQDAAAAVLRAIGAPTPTPACKSSCSKTSSPALPRRRRRPAAPAPRPRHQLRDARRLSPSPSPRQPGTSPAPPYPGRRPPRHLAHPQQHRELDRHVRGRSRRRCAQLQQLLPDLERVLGPVHPQTLGTRGNIAYWAGECGDATKALRLYRELLPDLERVLGPSHPDTLATRNNIASWTGACGDPAAALRLYQELLPDLERVARPRPPRHPRHPQQHRLLDRRVRGCGAGAAAVPRAAARPGPVNSAPATPPP